MYLYVYVSASFCLCSSCYGWMMLWPWLLKHIIYWSDFVVAEYRMLYKIKTKNIVFNIIMLNTDISGFENSVDH